MQNLKLLAAVGLVSVILSLGVSLSTKPATIEVTNEIPVPLGGTNPDVISPYLRWGGVSHWAVQTNALNAASTTVCSLQSPAATSTLLSGGVSLSYSSTSASTLQISKATTPAASTTLLIVSPSISANAKATLVASSTSMGAGDLWAPNTWFNVTMKGGDSGTFSPTGSCHAEWIQVSY